MTSLIGRNVIAIASLCCFGTQLLAQEGDATSTDITTVASMDWLAGHWIRESRRNGVTVSTIEEYWMGPKGDLMLGVNRSVRSDGRTAFEFMRIAATEEGISFFASPNGVPATEFPLKSRTKDQVVFENLNHDFPQRIIYRRNDEQLIGRIEGTINGQEKFTEWIYVPAGQ